jgi:hypothetical protein
MLLEKLKRALKKSKQPEKQPIVIRGFTPKYSKPVTISMTKNIRSPRKGSVRKGSPRKGSVRKGSPRKGSVRKGSPRKGSARKGSPRKY